PRAELVGEVAAEGGVVHEPSRDARLEVPHARSVGEQRERQLGVRLVGLEGALRGGEVEVGRVARRGNRIGDLRTGLAAELVPDGERDRRSEEHTSELQSPYDLVCRLL